MEELRKENEVLRSQLASSRNQTSGKLQQVTEERSLSHTRSIWLASVSRLVRTNEFARADVFLSESLSDAGAQTFDNALRTSLHALFRNNSVELEKFSQTQH